MLSEFLIWEEQEEIVALAFCLRNVKVVKDFGPIKKGEVYPLVNVFYDVGEIQVYPKISQFFTFKIKVIHDES